MPRQTCALRKPISMARGTLTAKIGWSLFAKKSWRPVSIPAPSARRQGEEPQGPATESRGRTDNDKDSISFGRQEERLRAGERHRLLLRDPWRGRAAAAAARRPRIDRHVRSRAP